MNETNIHKMSTVVQYAGVAGCFYPGVMVEYDRTPEQNPTDWDILFNSTGSLQLRVAAAQRVGYRAGIAGWCLPFCTTPELVVKAMKDAGTDVDYLRKWVEGAAVDWLELEHQQAHDLFNQRLGVTWRLTHVVLVNLANTGQVNWGLAAPDQGRMEERDQHPDTVNTGVLPISDREKAVWRSARNEGYQEGYETGAYDTDDQCKQAYDQGKEDGRMEERDRRAVAEVNRDESRKHWSEGFAAGWNNAVQYMEGKAGK